MAEMLTSYIIYERLTKNPALLWPALEELHRAFEARFISLFVTFGHRQFRSTARASALDLENKRASRQGLEVCGSKLGRLSWLASNPAGPSTRLHSAAVPLRVPPKEFQLAITD